MKSFFKKYILAIVIALSMISLLKPIPTTHAAGLGFDVVDQIQTTSKVIKFNSASEFIIAVIKVGLSIMGLVATAMVIYGGYLYVTAMGDEKKAEQGKHVILYAVIGLIIIGGAAILTNVIISTFKAP